MPLATAPLRLSPLTMGGAFQEPRDPVGLTGLPLPDDLRAPLAPATKTLAPEVPAVFSARNERSPDFSGRFVGKPEQMPVSSPHVAASCQQLLVNTTA